MPERADAHIHLFAGGYQSDSFVHGHGCTMDEAVSYDTLAKAHDIAAALVVGYEGVDWCGDNNAHIAAMASKSPWVYPAAFVDPARPPSIEQLEAWRVEGFVGLVLYLFEPAQCKAVQALDDGVWSWLVEHHWLVSVNSRAESWRTWLPVLERHAQLHVVASHLGLPGRAAEPPDGEQAAHAVADVAALAQFPGPHVKLSGFYAATDPGYDYPHRAAWPYVEALRDAFGIERLLWGSDFSPSLPWLSFPQTFGMFAQMPFFDDADCARIEGANLLALLAAASA